MKKVSVVMMMCLLILLSACHFGKDNIVEPEKNKVIDQEVLSKIEGDWWDNTYDFGEYSISINSDTIKFNEMELIVDYAEDNEIYTNEKNDEKSHVLFRIEEDQVEVLQTHEVPKGSKGGDLAPITLTKKQGFNPDFLYGFWQSIEEDYPGHIWIRSTFYPDQFHFYVSEKRDFQDDSFEVLKLVSETDEQIVMVNEAGTIKYTFSLYETDKLLIVSSPTDTKVEGTARPWIVSRER